MVSAFEGREESQQGSPLPSTPLHQARGTCHTSLPGGAGGRGRSRRRRLGSHKGT